MRLIRNLSHIALGLFLLAARIAGAQEAPPVEESFSDQIEVSLVNLEVIVADKSGKPIPDLRKEDFEVLEDGKPVEVTNFYAENGQPAGSPADSPASNTAARPIDQRLNLVVFVDDYNMEPQNRSAILDGVRDFLGKSLSPGDRVMVVRYGRSLEVRKPFTTSVPEVLSELDVVGKLAGNLASRESSRDHQIQVVADALEIGGWGATAEARIREYAEVETSYVAASLNALETVVGWLAGIPGRKAILYASDGLPSVPGEDLFIWAEAYSGFRSGQRISGMNAAAYDASELFRRVTSKASRNRVAIYPIEVMGARWVRGTRLQEARIQNRQNGLRFLAEETGGRAMFNVSQPAEALHLMASDISTYYSIGYRPQRVADDRDHKVEVRVKRKGAQVRYRQWYQDKPVSEAVADRTAATMAFGGEDNPLEAALEIGQQTPAGPEKTSFVVPVRIKVPIGKLYLEPKGDKREGRLRLFVVASGEGKVTPVRETKVVKVTVPEADFVAGKAKEYTYEVRITLESGSYTVGVGVRDEIATTTSYLQGKFEAGAPAR
ncbi:MAG TPA: VWA domain-containing protein [Thermoanaerobaculia bacterium]|jgi:VWFA-related protein|nr:VWA domain-containing protein [Thermoanaerobaculia bacterium]